jgi:16S rRNA (guanine527-N7)-methyltransferase
LAKTTVPPADQLTARLAGGMDELTLPYDVRLLEKLIHFLCLLDRWNRIYNLTSVRGIEQMVGAHLLDSLAALTYVQGSRVIDVGTGGGLPGVPLALACPEKHFVLLDSNAKKTRFVQQAVIELALDNITVVHGRVEAFQGKKPFDTVMTRAFSTLSDTLVQTAHLIAPGGRLLAWKGRFPVEELKCLSQSQGHSTQHCTIISLRVPGIEAERHLVCWSPPVRSPV